MSSRRQILKSAFGAFALVGVGAPNGISQTRRGPAPLPPPQGPDYTRLSVAVLNSYGLAAGNVWTGTNTSTLKSDDLVRVSALLRVTVAHLDEIGFNAYLDTRLSQPQFGTIYPDVIQAIGAQLQSYGILLSDAQVQAMYPVTVNASDILTATQLGTSGLLLRVASNIDLAAQNLRLQEIATACEALLPLLPSPQSSMRAEQPNSLRPLASSFCSGLQSTISATQVAFNVASEALVVASLA